MTTQTHTTFNCQTSGDANRMLQDNTELINAEQTSQVCHLTTDPLNPPPLHNHHSHLSRRMAYYGHKQQLNQD
jgi:hypothetical protein